MAGERRRGAQGRIFHLSGSAPEVFLPLELLAAAVREAQNPPDSQNEFAAPCDAEGCAGAFRRRGVSGLPTGARASVTVGWRWPFSKVRIFGTVDTASWWTEAQSFHVRLQPCAQRLTGTVSGKKISQQ